MNYYDESTAFLGHWGLFQQVVFFLLCASAIPNGSGVVSFVFVADIPRHHCRIPEVNLTTEWFNAIIPTQVVDGEEELSRCSRYRLDVVRNLSAQGYVPGRDVNLTDLEQESCVDGWIYSTDIYQSTIVSEFDLVCSDQWKQPFTSTLYFIGVLIGSFFSGQISDRFGRKPVFFATLVIQTTMTFFQVFSPSWTVYTILILFSGLGQISNYVAAFVLGTEILSGNVRLVFSTLGMSAAYVAGHLMLPLFAYFLRDWKSLLLAISLPCLVYIPLWWLIPESPRWLLSQGRVEEAEAIVRKAAHQNKLEAPQVIQKEKHHTVLDLFQNINITITSLILWLSWATAGAGYNGLSLNTSKLAADPYISCFISGAVELPAYVYTFLVFKYFSRRLPTSGALGMGGVALCLIQVIPKSLPQLAIALEMLGKFAFSVCFSMVYAYTAELYPTVLRTTATGTCSTFSRLGSALAPFLFHLSIYSKYLPYIVLGSLAVVSAIVIQFLPESFGRSLPETIEQMHKWESPVHLTVHLHTKDHHKCGLSEENV
uniref:Major facilitator superfamily (MFS) profile domain-containing protein n=1 Tax=Sphaeramia orbicularis TaxID=375764 RepID=A0A672Y6F8_9TELE